MKKLALLILLALSLSACAAPAKIAAVNEAAAVETVANSPSSIAQFTLEDVTLAKQLADNAGDRIASQCYAYIIQVLPALDNNELTVVPKGAVSAFQNARNLVKKAKDGTSDDFTIACAPLYQDAKKDAIGLASLLTSVAARIGVKLF